MSRRSSRRPLPPMLGELELDPITPDRDVRLAGFAARAAARIIDLLIGLLVWITWYQLSRVAAHVDLLGWSDDAWTYAGIVGGLLPAGAVEMVQAGREGLTGQTVGKRMVGIATIDVVDHQPIGVRHAILRRFLAYGVGTPLGIGYLMVIADSHNRAWHDKLVGSIVVVRV